MKSMDRPTRSFWTLKNKTRPSLLFRSTFHVEHNALIRDFHAVLLLVIWFLMLLLSSGRYFILQVHTLDSYRKFSSSSALILSSGGIVRFVPALSGIVPKSPKTLIPYFIKGISSMECSAGLVVLKSSLSAWLMHSIDR